MTCSTTAKQCQAMLHRDMIPGRACIASPLFLLHLRDNAACQAFTAPLLPIVAPV